MSSGELGLYECAEIGFEIAGAEDLCGLLPALGGEAFDEFLGRFGFDVVGFVVDCDGHVGGEFVCWWQDLRHEEGRREASATVGDAP